MASAKSSARNEKAALIMMNPKKSEKRLLNDSFRFRFEQSQISPINDNVWYRMAVEDPPQVRDLKWRGFPVVGLPTNGQLAAAIPASTKARRQIQRLTYDVMPTSQGESGWLLFGAEIGTGGLAPCLQNFLKSFIV